MEERLNRAIKPDAQGIDKIIIKTVPRYKSSELSGEEWRISASIEFYRKGKLIETSGASNVSYAAQLVGARLIELLDNGKGFFAGEADTCDQEGCEEKGSVTLKKKFDYCHEGHKSEKPSNAYRLFCDRHSRRGDSSFDDSEQNYENRK